MEDTILIGDSLMVNVLGSPEPVRGDVFVFRYPPDIRQTFSKRCIGMPGDRIRIVNKGVYLNGKKLDEPYAGHKTGYVDAYRDNFPAETNVRLGAAGQNMLDRHVVNGEVVVPADNYFVLGDNRDASLDSRYWGFVPRANLVGKPCLVYWSYSASPQALNGPPIGQLEDRYAGFFTRTRWSRIFAPIHGYALN